MTVTLRFCTEACEPQRAGLSPRRRAAFQGDFLEKVRSESLLQERCWAQGQRGAGRRDRVCPSDQKRTLRHTQRTEGPRSLLYGGLAPRQKGRAQGCGWSWASGRKLPGGAGPHTHAGAPCRPGEEGLGSAGERTGDELLRGTAALATHHRRCPPGPGVRVTVHCARCPFSSPSCVP